MTEPVAIRTVGLKKAYGRVQALRGVDLEVRRGEVLGFLGPNGAGKTTTIRCLLDLIRPDGGTAEVLGLNPQADPVGVRRRVGYLPGELSLEPNAKVEAVLRYFAGLRGRAVDWAYARELARRLELDLGTAIKNLSKGNKQKVGVVQALMGRPELLMMDEPTSGLDPLMQQEVYRLLREAQGEGSTVFFSSHIIGEVEAIADRVAILRAGQIVQEARPDELVNLNMRRVEVRFKEAVDPDCVAALGRARGVTVLAGVDGPATAATLQVEGEMDEVVKALAALPVADLRTEAPSLEEVFLRYYAAANDK